MSDVHPRPGLTRRDFGKLTLAAVPAAILSERLVLDAQSRMSSTIHGVHIGAITYSFRSMPDPAEIVKAYATIGLGEMELMSNHAEGLAGIPAGPRGGGGRRGGTSLTAEQQAARDAAQKAVTDWRAAATEATFKPVRQKIHDAGIT